MEETNELRESLNPFIRSIVEPTLSETLNAAFAIGTSLMLGVGFFWENYSINLYLKKVK